MKLSFGFHRLACMLLVLPLLGVQCGPDDDDPWGTHLCDTGYNSDWTDAGTLVLTHDFPKECPLERPTTMSGGGTITETSASYPSSGKTERMYVRACDVYYVMSFTCNTILDSADEWFDYVAEGTYFKWRANAILSWAPGLNPDYVEFEAVCEFNASCWSDQPKSFITLSFNEPE